MCSLETNYYFITSLCFTSAQTLKYLSIMANLNVLQMDAFKSISMMSIQRFKDDLEFTITGVGLLASEMVCVHCGTECINKRNTFEIFE